MKKRKDVTSNGVKSLMEKGLNDKQIAEVYGCSISTVMQRRGRLKDYGEEKRPITKDELDMIRQECKPGDIVTVKDYRKLDDQIYTLKRGKTVKTRIAKKYRHLVTLENGLSLTYVELAMKRRGTE